MDKLAEIRQIYFTTSKNTIARDFDRAVDLLKSMQDDDERSRAVAYMTGLAELKKEWQRGNKV
jgi:hypothetical protein